MVTKSFRPSGVSIPEAMSRSNTSARADNRDRLVVVDEYDLARGRIKVTEVDSGKKFEVYVDPAKAAVGTASGTDDKWRGNCIDERMSSQVPVGSRMVLESATTEKWITVGGAKVGQLKANWIVNVPEAAPDKCFTGIITVNAHGHRLTNVQLWNEKAIDAQTPEGEAELSKLFEDANQIASDHAAKKRVIGLGVQFRAMVPKENDREGKPTYEVIDCSPPFDWVRAVPAQDGQDEVPGHPLDGKTIEDELVAYMDYLYGSEGDASKGIEASAPRFPADVLEKLVVEVMPYRAYQAAPRSDNMELKNERNPLYWMAHTRTKYNPEDEDYASGKNWAVRGIVMLTGDKKPEERGQDWEDRNLVTRLFVNSWKGNVHKMVRSSTGGRVNPHPGMDRPEVENATPRAQAGGLRSAPSQAAAPAASSPATSQPSTPSLQAPASDPFGGHDPFAAAFNGTGAAAPAAEVAAPVAEAPAEVASAATPAATPEATPEATADAPAATPATGRWSRRST